MLAQCWFKYYLCSRKGATWMRSTYMGVYKDLVVYSLFPLLLPNSKLLLIFREREMGL